MNYAITENPYNNNYVLSDGTFRVAKLNNVTKRPALVRNWEAGKAALTKNEAVSNMQQVVSDVAAPSHSYDVVLGRLAMTTEAYNHWANVNGYRKLKVNSLVKDKTKKVYTSTCKTNDVMMEVANNEAVINPVPPVRETIAPTVEPKMEIPVVNEPKVENTTPSYAYPASQTQAVNSFDTRSARYEHVAEANTSPVINTPDRFAERPISNPEVQTPMVDTRSYSRVERRGEDYSSNDELTHQEKVQVGKAGQDLDRIATLNHGAVNNTKSDLQNAYDNFNKSERTKNDLFAKVSSLKKAVDEAARKVDEQTAQQIADLVAREQANNAAIDEYTTQYNDLMAKLREYEEQLAADDAVRRRVA